MKLYQPITTHSHHDDCATALDGFTRVLLAAAAEQAPVGRSSQISAGNDRIYWCLLSAYIHSSDEDVVGHCS